MTSPVVTAMRIQTSIDVLQPHELLWCEAHVGDYRRLRAARFCWRRFCWSLHMHLVGRRRKSSVWGRCWWTSVVIEAGALYWWGLITFRVISTYFRHWRTVGIDWRRHRLEMLCRRKSWPTDGGRDIAVNVRWGVLLPELVADGGWHSVDSRCFTVVPRCRRLGTVIGQLSTINCGPWVVCRRRHVLGAGSLMSWRDQLQLHCVWRQTWRRTIDAVISWGARHVVKPCRWT